METPHASDGSPEATVPPSSATQSSTAFSLPPVASNLAANRPSFAEFSRPNGRATPLTTLNFDKSLMRKVSKIPFTASKAAVEEAMDEEFQDLMVELRQTAERVIREDEWKFRSSDEILGFKDNF